MNHLRKLAVQAFLTEIPTALAQMDQLEDLDLQNNQIRTLPEQFPFPPSLREVNLENNLLETLPICPGINLEHLENFFVVRNLDFRFPSQNPFPDTTSRIRYSRDRSQLILYGEPRGLPLPDWIAEAHID